MKFWRKNRNVYDPFETGGIIPLRNFPIPLRIIKRKSGNWGDVYICTEEDSNKKYAVKVSKKELIKDEVVVKKFLFEAQTWVHLKSHPNIVPLISCDTIHGTPVIIMDYTGESSLRDILNKDYNDYEGAILIAKQIAEGMRFLTIDNGLLHRDLKRMFQPKLSKNIH